MTYIFQLSYYEQVFQVQASRLHFFSPAFFSYSVTFSLFLILLLYGKCSFKDHQNGLLNPNRFQ